MSRFGAGALAVALAITLAGCGSGGFAGKQLKGSSPLPDFALHDDGGGVLSLSALRGRYVVVSFLYTHCTDVCPLLATNIGAALRTLGPEQPVSAIAVSVDPKGDTRGAVRAFLAAHDDPATFQYLIGGLAELRPVWQEFNVLVERRSAIRITHDAPVFVVDEQGRPVLQYDANVKSAQIVGDLRRLLR